MSDALNVKTKKILTELSHPSLEKDKTAVHRRIDSDTEFELKMISEKLQKRGHKQKKKKQLTEKTQQFLAKLATKGSVAKHKKTPEAINPETQIELDIISNNMKRVKQIAQAHANITEKTQEMLQQLKTHADKEDIQLIEHSILNGVSWSKIHSIMKRKNILWRDVAYELDATTQTMVQRPIFSQQLCPNLCMYDIEDIKDMFAHDADNILAQLLLDYLFSTRSAGSEPDPSKVDIMLRNISPMAGTVLVNFIQKAFLCENWQDLIPLFTTYLPSLSPENKNDIADTIHTISALEHYLAKPYLHFARQLRLSADQLEKIADGAFFQKMKDMEDMVDDFYKSKSALAIRLSLQQARAADPNGNFQEPEWTMAQFKKDFGAIATYERGKMTCEILSKSARERGIQYPSSYQPLRKAVLTAKIQMVAKKHHEIQRHLTQTELWWETATKTSVSIEKSVAALIAQGNLGTFEQIFAWFNNDTPPGITPPLDTTEIQQSVQNLNAKWGPMKEDLEYFEKMAQENVFQLEFLQAQINCYQATHTKTQLPAVPLVEKAREMFEKLSDYKEILEHLFKLSETRLKIATVSETTHFQYMRSLLANIKVIADKISRPCPPQSLNSAPSSPINSPPSSPINSAPSSPINSPPSSPINSAPSSPINSPVKSPASSRSSSLIPSNDPNESSDEESVPQEEAAPAPRRSTRNNRQTDFYDDWSKEQMKTLLRKLRDDSSVDLGGMQLNADEGTMRRKLRDLQKKGVINKGIIKV